MARVRAILGALLRLSWREISSDHTISGNNLLLLLLFMAGSAAIGFPLLVLGGLLLVAMSAYPLSRVPSERLSLWPLSHTERTTLRVLALGLNPAPLVLLPLLLIQATRLMAVLLLACVVLLQVAAGLLHRRRGEDRSSLRFWTPTIPGPLGELIRKDIRQITSYLDFWVAFVFCLGGTIYRFAADAPDPESAPVISSLAAMIMGTSAQCLFGLDGAAGFTRYRLLPLSGWQIIAAKGTAWLVLLLALTLPLSPLAALSAGLVALAVGHHRSVRRPLPQKRWRFTNGSLIMLGLIQSVLTISAGMLTSRIEPSAALACAFCYAVSLFFYGRRWERLIP